MNELLIWTAYNPQGCLLMAPRPELLLLLLRTRLIDHRLRDFSSLCVSGQHIAHTMQIPHAAACRQVHADDWLSLLFSETRGRTHFPGCFSLCHPLDPKYTGLQIHGPSIVRFTWDCATNSESKIQTTQVWIPQVIKAESHLHVTSYLWHFHGRFPVFLFIFNTALHEKIEAILLSLLHKIVLSLRHHYPIPKTPCSFWF